MLMVYFKDVHIYHEAFCKLLSLLIQFCSKKSLLLPITYLVQICGNQKLVAGNSAGHHTFSNGGNILQIITEFLASWNVCMYDLK